MQEATCNRCGASVVFSAKFCRQCGNPLDTSEMTTRSLDAPPAEAQSFDHPTRPANAGITSPTYAPPSMMQPQPPASIIGSAPPANNKTVLFVLLGIIAALMICLGVVAFLVLGRSSSIPIPPPPPRATSEKAPPAGQPGIPPPPPGIVPPMPAPPGGGNVQFPFDDALLYPNAKTVMAINARDGRVAQLQSSDPIDKVAGWYLDKLKATEDVRMPGQRILSGKGMKVILSGGDEGTMIMLTEDKD
ncbi:MAG TPA: hypothetical protein VJZ91_07840 [Blastocatellia bacterium]|nr:hypothetical protein [Blastocatellia bacterium]